MKPQKQLLRHNPPASYGDCFRTAIAIVLDMDAADVPHFMDGGVSGDDGAAAAEAFLNAHGMTAINIVVDGARPLQAVLDSIAGTNLRQMPAFLLTGTSRNSCAHVVVGCNGDIVCDPSIDGSGIVGPCDDGFYWLTFFGALQATNGQAKHQRDARSARERLEAASMLLCAELWKAGLDRGSFYVTIGGGELHVYARCERPEAMPSCAYPVEWHVAEVKIDPVSTEAA
ncbi:hypothetical protein [Bradyrhizobium betae]|uniref:Uncharacterized protein n=1 Tax=Bradyrhizobium betae TaxID=244734 RepID=A0A5P6NZ94_9BRAD|nr:hypothetical protein [Bradyrhizobium betae]MCS3725473.1 hypothetical protein [Bradyrhizobium betae]QFI71236.1 hypothetical protein F8237_01910 [Bradyrhizobium betae]